MSTLVISQPMLFPWIGLFAQIKLCDHYVHYDDVQFSKGSFTNRVQIKTNQGSVWMSIPTAHFHLGQLIKDVRCADPAQWKSKHLQLLESAYAHTPYAHEVLSLCHAVYQEQSNFIKDYSEKSIQLVCDYFGLNTYRQFSSINGLYREYAGSARVLLLTQHFKCDRYVTGHGAKNYLQHEDFAQAGIDVAYMDYTSIRPYPQSYGAFTPYVSILDLIAHQGKNGLEYLTLSTIDWRDFIASHTV